MVDDGILRQPIEKIEHSGSVLLDASSVISFCKKPNWEAFTQPLPKQGGSFRDYIREAIANAIKLQRFDYDRYQSDQSSLVNALSFLEQYLLCDRVYVDFASLESLLDRPEHLMRERWSSFQGIVSFVDVSESTYRTIGKNIRRFHKGLENLGIDSIFVKGSFLNLGVDRDMVPLKDGILSRSYALLGNSNNSPLRALFYHELSHETGLPLILHPEKSSHLSQLGRALVSAYSQMYNALTGKILAELDLSETELPIPPLADLLLETACDSGRSLVSVAAELHSDPEVVSLRGLLASLLSSQYEKGRFEALNQLEESALRISGRIKERIGISSFLSRKTIQLSKIPAISKLTGLIGWDSLTVPDLTLWEKPYVTLMNRWVKSQ